MQNNTTHFKKICHDIRNFRPLTKEQSQSILLLPEKEKDEIILLYNEIVKSYNYYLSDHK
jgi:hypothetical protein